MIELWFLHARRAEKRSRAPDSSLCPWRLSAGGAMRLATSFGKPRMPPVSGHRYWLSWARGGRLGPRCLALSALGGTAAGQRRLSSPGRAVPWRGRLRRGNRMGRRYRRPAQCCGGLRRLPPTRPTWLFGFNEGREHNLAIFETLGSGEIEIDLADVAHLFKDIVLRSLFSQTSRIRIKCLQHEIIVCKTFFCKSDGHYKH